jgi:hypothetical protein
MGVSVTGVMLGLSCSSRRLDIFPPPVLQDTIPTSPFSEILTFHSWENIYLKFICLVENFDYKIQRGIIQTSIPDPKYILWKRKQIHGWDHLCSSSLEI